MNLFIKKGKNKLTLEDLLKQLSAKKKISSADVLDTISKLSKVHRSIREQEELTRREELLRANEEKQKKRELARQERELKKEQAEKERIESITSMDLPLDYQNAFFGDERAKNINAQTLSDGLVASLNVLGKVDIEYISTVTGKTFREVIESLKGSIYQNPLTWDECFYKGWETADEYLSGNLSKKWRDAKTANDKYHGYFKDNVKAIETILPKSVATKDIFVTIGSPWIPTDIIDDFIEYLFGKSYVSGKKEYFVKHDEVTGTWDIPEKNRYYNNAKVYSTYGTRRMPALYILERTLNMRPVAITEEVACKTNKSGKKRVINQSETLSAIEKQKKLIETFRSWVWQSETRKERLISIYEEKYSSYRVRRYDGRFLEFPEMNKSITLRPHQKDAIARIIFSPNTLLAHDVGSGKTFIMISAGMELKRMRLSEKNLYVVPNNLVGQWKKMFTQLYPKAKILVVAPKDFTPSKRYATFIKMRDNDYDGIVIASSCFDMIPLSKEYYEEKLKEKKALLDQLSKQTTKNTTGVKNEKKKIDEELLELARTVLLDQSESIAFDELGVTRLFVDEAHSYKNLNVQTKATNVLGLATAGSKKCKDMLDKVRHVQKKGGVIMATGTPITNSITDAFVMQYYLQYGELQLLDLQSFDSWIGMFAETQSEFEVDVDTSKYRLATRFSKFHNLPELTSILSTIADFHQTDLSDELPTTNGYDDSLIAKTSEFNAYLQKISSRADAVRSRLVSPKEDNMLKITTDGRKGALDLRLVENTAQFTYLSKVFYCAENVANVYYKTMESKSAQLVFCDTSTPKAGFNVYDELKRLLLTMGIPAQEIAYVHDATSDKKRDELFKQVSQGVIRVLIGSTMKLGLGVNVQSKLIALHHLDVPWRPADMVQREGRIIRPGNTNKAVRIFRYITEGSFDAYSWQLLESKQRFISALLSGSIKERSGSDISDTVLNYAEVKALAIGNPLIKKRVELANELTRLYSLRRKYVENRTNLEQELCELPEKIAKTKILAENCKIDATYYETQKSETTKEERFEIRQQIFDAVCENVMKDTETIFTTYKGFDVVLPAHMPKEKPHLYLQKIGRYYVEIGESEKGVIIRLDNCLEGLSDRCMRLQGSYEQLCRNRQHIVDELSKDEDYEEKINSVKTKLEEIDKKLGVNKK